MRAPVRDQALNQRWLRYWAGIDNERLLAVGALLDLSQTVREDVARWLRTEMEPLFDDAGDEVGEQEYDYVDWDGWATDLESAGRPFSSTEANLAKLVAALAAGRPINLVQVLEYTGSWENQLWTVLVEWGTGGNNRGDLPGRATVVSR
ncbi:hypothetical protein [Mycolicibacter sinensis]|uniref:Uncharacterized protein n=1 Tax=Mycolicibacter sinensis (strain JDM601) TaxID=875328 RepID=A0A1A2XTI0_MYCSD|nr:hypothetical protein [Mycolicibacter sinensis]OBI29055.1 hypothetical protein A5710_22665 [Mycolicibacter sinensis]